MNNVLLDNIASTKYLGIIIDNKLNFLEHINFIVKRSTGILYMLMRSLKKAHTLTKKTAFFTICRPILEFSSIIWSPHHQKYIDKLEAVNRRAFRWAFNKSKHDHISHEMENNDWPTLKNRRELSDMAFYDKILTNQVAVSQNKLYSKQKSVHDTRYGPTIGNINSDVKKYSYFNRIHRRKILDPS